MMLVVSEENIYTNFIDVSSRLVIVTRLLLQKRAALVPGVRWQDRPGRYAGPRRRFIPPEDRDGQARVQRVGEILGWL
jgi:hypothetical protein